MAVQVRPATPADAGGIAEVHVAAWKVAYIGQVPDEFLDGLSVPQREVMWQGILSLASWPRGGCFVAEDDQDIIGFASFGPDRDGDPAGETGEITAIYLHPAWWGRGCGRQLMTRAVSHLSSAGYEEAVLWVLATNVRARRFYEAGGWFPDGGAKADDERGFTLHELRYRTRLGR